MHYSIHTPQIHRLHYISFILLCYYHTTCLSSFTQPSLYIHSHCFTTKHLHNNIIDPRLHLSLVFHLQQSQTLNMFSISPPRAVHLSMQHLSFYHQLLLCFSLLLYLLHFRSKSIKAQNTYLPFFQNLYTHQSYTKDLIHKASLFCKSTLFLSNNTCTLSNHLYQYPTIHIAQSTQKLVHSHLLPFPLYKETTHELAQLTSYFMPYFTRKSVTLFSRPENPVWDHVPQIMQGRRKEHFFPTFPIGFKVF